MKHFLAWILIFTTILCVCGCAQKEPEIQSPVTFYYRRSEVSFEDSTGVIVEETQEASGHENDLSELMKQYFRGPVSSDMHYTFPNGTDLISLRLQNDQAYVLVTNHLADAKGLDLTIACACITMTVMELTGAKSVEIKAERALLNDAESIVMDAETLLMLDDTAMDTAE